MGDVAQLLTAIAALITATGGAAAGIMIALASLRKQRSAAAEEAVRLSPAPRHGRHELADQDAVLRELAADAADTARGLTQLSQDLGRDSAIHRLEQQREPPRDDPSGGAHV